MMRKDLGSITGAGHIAHSVTTGFFGAVLLKCLAAEVLHVLVYTAGI